MQIEQLQINNFGVYEGIHRFDFSTGSVDGKDNKNIVIIKGANGSGKSTLFNSVALVLFGRQMLGNRVSQKNYDEYIRSRFHKARFAGNKEKADDASISITLNYVESGKSNTIHVHREWHRGKSGIKEELSIFKNGKPPAVQEIDYQTWLNDLFPPGLLPVLCFDSEDMNQLLKAKNDEELKKITKRLLGLHLVEQLEEDLDYYLRKHGGGANYETLKDDVVDKQKVIDRFKNQIEEKKAEEKSLIAEEEELTSDLNRLERDLSSEGGDYAARRPIIKERIRELEEDIEVLENKVRDACSGLLPFTLAPKLSQKLSERLDDELELHRRQIASDYLHDKIDQLSDKLSHSSLWKKHEINKDLSKEIITFLEKKLKSEKKTPASNLVHELAENDVVKLQGWINEVENSVPELILHLTSDLKEKKLEKSEHHEYLNRAPDDDKLEPIFKKIREVEERLGDLRKEIRDTVEELSRLEYKLEEAEREKQKAIEKLKEVEKSQREFSLAEKSQLVLKSYYESLSIKRLQKLSEELVKCFNRICEKDQLLSDAYIDPDTFEVVLTDQNGETVSVSELSMGEGQIYGLSLLWALRNISGYQLPLLIDTPIARLDREHRSNFIHEFLPEISNQVMLFATTVEMNEEVQEEVEPITAHFYELDFDEKNGSTCVTGDGYQSDFEKEAMQKVGT